MVPEACHKMIVDHAGCLHERVTDRGADKFETAAHQIPAHRVGFFCPWRNFFQGLPMVMDGPPFGELPDVGIERPELLLYFEKAFCIADRGMDLGFVTYDPSVIQEGIDLFLVIPCNLAKVEIIKCCPEIFSFMKDGFPTQPSLEAVEHHEFKKFTVVVYRGSPFLIMVLLHERIVRRPFAGAMLCWWLSGFFIPGGFSTPDLFLHFSKRIKYE
jgi:hypothetical protein